MKITREIALVGFAVATMLGVLAHQRLLAMTSIPNPMAGQKLPDKQMVEELLPNHFGAPLLEAVLRLLPKMRTATRQIRPSWTRERQLKGKIAPNTLFASCPLPEGSSSAKISAAQWPGVGTRRKLGSRHRGPFGSDR